MNASYFGTGEYRDGKEALEDRPAKVKEREIKIVKSSPIRSYI